ncbi:MAG: hypothetical protein QW393_03235 [Candidatus Micrarchaeaceae archaeon]
MADPVKTALISNRSRKNYREDQCEFAKILRMNELPEVVEIQPVAEKSVASANSRPHLYATDILNGYGGRCAFSFLYDFLDMTSLHFS